MKKNVISFLFISTLPFVTFCLYFISKSDKIIGPDFSFFFFHALLIFDWYLFFLFCVSAQSATCVHCIFSEHFNKYSWSFFDHVVSQSYPALGSTGYTPSTLLIMEHTFSTPVWVQFNSSCVTVILIKNIVQF